jgi:hypothetical protein
VTVLGVENQPLPVLLLADVGMPAPGARAHAGQRFIDDKDGILRALSARHGFSAAASVIAIAPWAVTSARPVRTRREPSLPDQYA